MNDQIQKGVKFLGRLAKAAIFLIISLIVIGVVYSSLGFGKPSHHAPEPAVINSAWDGSVWQVKNWLKTNLKDPDSFEAIEWSKVAKVGDSYAVTCKYRAKNSFGGYVIEVRNFTLDTSGNITGSVLQ